MVVRNNKAMDRDIGRGGTAIWQVFPKSDGVRHFPYPPVYRQNNADYICFTDDKTVASPHWDVRFMEKLDDGVIESQLSPYAHRYRLEPGQIQMGALSDADFDENILLEAIGDSLDIKALLRTANDCRNNGDKSMAVRIFAQVMSLSVEKGDKWMGEGGCLGLMLSLYSMDDGRLFGWYDDLAEKFHLDIEERTAIDWCRESLAFRLGRPAQSVVKYYNSYMAYLRQYRRKSGNGQNDDSLPMVNGEGYITDAKAIAFCSYAVMPETKKALEVLSQFELDAVEKHRNDVLTAGIAAVDEVFEALCAKLTDSQWEEWGCSILDAWRESVLNEDIYERQMARMPVILAKISYETVMQWKGQNRIWEIPKWMHEKYIDDGEICRFLKQGEILEVEKALTVMPVGNKKLAILSRLIEIFHNEVPNDVVNTIFDYSTDLDELTRHYTRTKLMLRRIEFGMPYRYIDEFYDYCEENKVSVYMLAQFVLANVFDKEKVCRGLADLYTAKKGVQSTEARYFMGLGNQIRRDANNGC
jgi:hypothetical protein